MNLPRGIRNNNPGNIRRSRSLWAGLSSDQPDPDFVSFSAPEYGIRAMARIFLNDWKAGKKSVNQLISEWAPPSENNTGVYVSAVAGACSVDPYEDCDLPTLLPRFLAAVIRHENGQQPYTDDIIRRAIQLETA